MSPVVSAREANSGKTGASRAHCFKPSRLLWSSECLLFAVNNPCSATEYPFFFFFFFRESVRTDRFFFPFSLPPFDAVLFSPPSVEPIDFFSEISRRADAPPNLSGAALQRVSFLHFWDFYPPDWYHPKKEVPGTQQLSMKGRSSASALVTTKARRLPFSPGIVLPCTLAIAMQEIQAFLYVSNDRNI